MKISALPHLDNPAGDELLVALKNGVSMNVLAAALAKAAVQPQVDLAHGYANQAKSTFRNAYLNTGVDPYETAATELVIGSTAGADADYGATFAVWYSSNAVSITQGGFVSKIGVELTAAGTGQIAIVDKNQVPLEIYDLAATEAGEAQLDLAATNTFIRPGDRVFYRRLTGGNLRELSAGGPGGVTILGDITVGEGVDYSGTATTPSISVTVLADANNLATQVAQMRAASVDTDDYLLSNETEDGFILDQITNQGVKIEGSIFASTAANAAATGVIAGAVTDSSFAVVADIASAGAGVTELEVSTDDGFKNRVYISPPTIPTRTAKSENADYRTILINALNLRANTFYYYRLVVDGVAGETRSLRTFPTQGVPAAFTVAFGSCNPRTDRNNYPAFAAIGAAAPLLFFHLGDLAYSNIDIDDIRRQRAENVRWWRAAPAVTEMLKTVPVAYVFDNHDSGPPSKDVSEFDGTTWDIVLSNSIEAAKETFPFYPLALPNGLAQEINIGAVRFLFTDTTSFRKATAPDKTMLGAAQMAWVKARLADAAAAGVERVVIISTERFQDWGGYYDIQDLATFINGTEGLPPILLIDGDVHYCGVDDGNWVDTIAGGTGTFKHPLVRSSGLALGAANLPTEADENPMQWNGVDSSFPGKTDGFVLLDFAVGGAFTARVYSEPYDGTNATLNGSYSSLDLAA